MEKGDGPSLAKLINETRNLASENAAFCELNGKLTDELRALRRNEANFQSQIESARAAVAAQKAELAKLNETQHQFQLKERDVNRKLRNMTENYEVEREKAKMLELKVSEQVELRREFEERLKLQRGDIHTLRQENLDLLKSKENFAKSLKEARDENEKLKSVQKATQRSLDEATFRQADFEHQLSLAKSDLTMTTERLNTATDESELQQQKETRILADLDSLRSRLSDSEQLNNEQEAELTVLRGKLRASQDHVNETNKALESREVDLKNSLLKIDKLEDDLSKLKVILKQETDSKIDEQRRIEKVTEALTAASDESKRLSDELDRNDRERLAEREQLRKSHEQAISLLETEIKDQQVVNARLKGDIDEANDLLQRKEATIVDQFKKIEELIIADGKNEVEIASLREKNLTSSKNLASLGAALDGQTRENSRLALLIEEKDKFNGELTEKLEAQIRSFKKAEKELSTTKIALASATRTAREAEAALTELTAEQARNLTQNSQLARNHQMKMSELEADHKRAFDQLQNEHTSITGDLDTIKKEWESRARSAEEKLVKLVTEHEIVVASLKKMKKKAKLIERKQQTEQLEILQRVKRQQDDLIFQKQALGIHSRQLNFVKLVMSELIIIKKELNEKKAPILRFRRAVLVVLAANRLKSKNYASQNELGYESMSLCRRLKCGLQNIQFSCESINLTNSTFLAEAIRKIIHEQTEKNWKLTNHVASLKKKLKSSTSFMNDLEKRVVTMETARQAS